MPYAEWVIDKDDNFTTPRERRFKVGLFVSDLHGKWSYLIGRPEGFIKLIARANYDAVFLRYRQVLSAGCDPDIFFNRLSNANWVPWSVDGEFFHPRSEKRWDITFLGAHSPKFYPLRDQLWRGLPAFCNSEGLRLLRRESPPGKTFERRFNTLKNRYVVGHRYADVLRRSRIFIFGCSKFRYPLQKFFEGMASGCLVMADRPTNAEELGFIDGETFVQIGGKNWRDRVRHYLRHPGEMERIANNGRKLILEKHTHHKRAKDFARLLRRIP